MRIGYTAQQRVAVRAADGNLYRLSAGVYRTERVLKPVTNSFQYIGSGAVRTEIAGYRESLKFSACRIYGDTANDFLFALMGQSGADCETEVFIYDVNDVAAGGYMGRLYPAATAITSMRGRDGEVAVYGFSGELYLNGEGSICIRAVSE